MKLFKKKEEVKERELIDQAIDEMIIEIRAIQKESFDILMGNTPTEEGEYDMTVVKDQYDKSSKILTELYRIKKENSDNSNIENKKIWIPVLVAVIGLGGTVLTIFGNGRINAKMAEMILHFEETGTIKSFAGRKINWFVRGK